MRLRVSLLPPFSAALCLRRTAGPGPGLGLGLEGSPPAWKWGRHSSVWVCGTTPSGPQQAGDAAGPCLCVLAAEAPENHLDVLNLALSWVFTEVCLLKKQKQFSFLLLSP